MQSAKCSKKHRNEATKIDSKKRWEEKEIKCKEKKKRNKLATKSDAIELIE